MLTGAFPLNHLRMGWRRWPFIDCIKQRIRTESHPQVRNIHKSQLFRRKVDPRYTH
jgi:hypothetical protein